MTMFQLALLRREAGEALPVRLSECLIRAKSGVLDWELDLSDSTILLVADGKEWIATNKDSLSVPDQGELWLVVEQLDAARERLAAGKKAIFRAADDEPGASYILFDPEGDIVKTRMVFIGDDEYSLDYPVERGAGMTARIYGYVAANPDHLETVWGPLELPLEQLLQAFDREARLAEELGRALNEPLRKIRPRRSDREIVVNVIPRARANSIDERPMMEIPGRTSLMGLTPEEADALALELTKMEEVLESEREHLDGNWFSFEDTLAARREWLETSMPAHEVEVGDFRIDRYPVTNEQWLAYMKETGAAAPRTWGSDTHYEPLSNFVRGVSWKEALAYAHHYGLDLPTEAEWELAARKDRRFFTWGNEYFPQGRLAFREACGGTWAVGSKPELASPYEVYDLLGEFGEFCKDRFAPYPNGDEQFFTKHFFDWHDYRTVRGGYDVYQDSTCVFRTGVPEDERPRFVKFRCVLRRRGLEQIPRSSLRHRER